MTDSPRAVRKAEASHQTGALRILPVHHRGPRGHQGQGAQAAGVDEGGRRAAGSDVQTHRPRRRPALHEILPLQEREAAGRRRQREGPARHGEPGPLAVAGRQRSAVLRVRDQGSGLRRRHGNEVRAHRRPRRGQRRRRRRHHHRPTSEGPAGSPTSSPGSTNGGWTTRTCSTTT